MAGSLKPPPPPLPQKVELLVIVALLWCSLQEGLTSARGVFHCCTCGPASVAPHVSGQPGGGRKTKQGFGTGQVYSGTPPPPPLSFSLEGFCRGVVEICLSGSTLRASTDCNHLYLYFILSFLSFLFFALILKHCLYVVYNSLWCLELLFIPFYQKLYMMFLIWGNGVDFRSFGCIVLRRCSVSHIVFFYRMLK